MTDNRAIFTVYEDKYVLMHIAEDKLMHLYVYPALNGLDLGTVINCRIDSQLENIDACFIRYGQKSTGYLEGAYKNGNVLPLMLKKEAINDKKPLFSDVITIEGEYVVISNGPVFVKASSKIPAPKREVYIQSLKDDAIKEHVGVIVRYAAYYEPDGIDKAKDEFNGIVNILKNIALKSEHAALYSILYRPVPSYINDILYLVKSGIEEVVTDIYEIHEVLQNEHETVTGPVALTDRVGLRFYKDDLLEISKLYSFDKHISDCLRRKVYLKSGAYITIDTTEALTAIDVNTASNDGKTSKDETFLEVNLEAATEIARQLVLRNIGGMIVIDFINMDNDIYYDELKDHLTGALKDDREYCRFIDFTGLKLCELTRTRRGKTLYQSLRSK